MRYDVAVYVMNKLFGGCRDHPTGAFTDSLHQINENIYVTWDLSVCVIIRKPWKSKYTNVKKRSD